MLISTALSIEGPNPTCDSTLWYLQIDVHKIPNTGVVSKKMCGQ